MFDQILNLVKEHLGNNPQIASAIPADQQDAVHEEVATHISNGLAGEAPTQGGAGGILDMLKGAVSGGSPITSIIEGGLVGTLGKKFGLSPVITGAIAAALPAILQKIASKASDPDDHSITPDSLTKGAGGLGGLFKFSPL